MLPWNTTIYYYEMSDGSFVRSDLFYTYDFGIRIYQVEYGHVLCIMEDKTVLKEPRYITPPEWTLILMKAKGISKGS